MFSLGEWLISSYLIIAVVVNRLHCLCGFFNVFHIEIRFLLCERFSLAWLMKLPPNWRKSLCEAGITLVLESVRILAHSIKKFIPYGTDFLDSD